MDGQSQQRGHQNHLVHCPLSTDVVFKSGTQNADNPGNSVFQEILRAHCWEYMDAATSDEKKDVVVQIMKEVVERGGRFLEWDKDLSCWRIMDNTRSIHVKTYNSLLYMAKNMSATKAMQSMTSGTNIFESSGRQWQ